jgi:phage tail-like protein
MARRDDDLLLRTSYFQVLIDGRELGFAEITPFTSRTDPSEPTEHRQNQFDTVVLRRALTRSSELYAWRKRIVRGTHDRRKVTIRQLEAPGGAVANEWTLVDAWPCRWSGPAFDAQSSEIAMEELELAFGDLVWHGEPDHEGG